MNKQLKKILFFTSIIIIVIAFVSLVVFAVMSQGDDGTSKEPNKQTQTQQPVETNKKYIRMSTKSWADRAWIGQLSPEKITTITFVRNRSDQIVAESAWVFDGFSCYFNKGTVYFVVGADGVKITNRSMSGAFSELPNLTNIEGLSFLDTSEVTDMSNLFKNDTSLQSIAIENLNTQSVILANGMFQGCKSLKKLNMSKMNMYNVVDANKMFAQCSSIDDLNLPKFRDVISMSGMFERIGTTSSYKTNVQGELNTQSCEDMSYMFSGANMYDYELAQNFNTENLKNAEGMFSDCVINEIDLSKWNTAKLETVEKMFYSVSGMIKCNTSGWNMQSLVNCENMFYRCTSLMNIELGWTNLSIMQNTAYLFKDCYEMRTIDISCFDDVLIGDAREMFANCESLTTIYGGGFSADVSDRMFIWCEELVGAVKYSEDFIDVQMANTNGYFKKRG